MRFSPVPLHFVIGVGPTGLMPRHIGKLVKGLAEKLGTGQAPTDPGMFTTAVSDGSDARKGGDLIGLAKAFPTGAQGHQEPGCQGFPGSRQALEASR